MLVEKNILYICIYIYIVIYIYIYIYHQVESPLWLMNWWYARWADEGVVLHPESLD